MVDGRRWRSLVVDCRRRMVRRRFDGGGGGGAEEYGGGVVGDREGLAGGEGDESGAGEAEVAAVVGVCGGEVVAGVHCFFHEAATLLASPDCVFVF